MTVYRGYPCYFTRAARITSSHYCSLLGTSCSMIIILLALTSCLLPSNTGHLRVTTRDPTFSMVASEWRQDIHLFVALFRTGRVRKRKKYALNSKIKRHLRLKVRVWRRPADTSGGSLCWASEPVVAEITQELLEEPGKRCLVSTLLKSSGSFLRESLGCGKRLLVMSFAVIIKSALACRPTQETKITSTISQLTCFYCV